MAKTGYFKEVYEAKALSNISVKKKLFERVGKYECVCVCVSQNLEGLDNVE